MKTELYGTNVNSRGEMYLHGAINDFMLAQRPDGMLALFKLRNGAAGWSEEIYEMLEDESADIGKKLIPGEDLSSAVRHGGILELNRAAEHVRIQKSRIILPEKFGLRGKLILIAQTGNVIEIHPF